MTLESQLLDLFRPHLGPNFFPDGPVDSKKYSETNPKIVYLLKEVNSTPNEHWDLREMLQEWLAEYEETGELYRTWKQASYFMYGMLHQFPPFQEVISKPKTELADALRSIAVINVKKTSGKSTADYDQVREHALHQDALWKKQIDIINPDFVVCGGTFDIAHESYAYPTRETTPSGMDYFFTDRSIVLDFYHPLARTRIAAMYAYLKEGMKKFS